MIQLSIATYWNIPSDMGIVRIVRRARYVDLEGVDRYRTVIHREWFPMDGDGPIQTDDIHDIWLEKKA